MMIYNATLPIPVILIGITISALEATVSNPLHLSATNPSNLYENNNVLNHTYDQLPLTNWFTSRRTLPRLTSSSRPKTNIERSSCQPRLTSSRQPRPPKDPNPKFRDPLITIPKTTDSPFNSYTSCRHHHAQKHLHATDTVSLTVTTFRDNVDNPHIHTIEGQP